MGAMTLAAAIVIPTRNRADHAIAAIRSLLAIADRRLAQVIVSNNSSEPEHVERLADFCATSADPRLVHLRPSRPMAMAEHWDWAIRESLARSKATHLGLHYDRRISKPEMTRLFDVAERWPDRPTTYLLDMVYPVFERFFVLQMPWSGGAYEIRSVRALELAANGDLTDLWQAFPVLVNCLTPRAVFERVCERFGDVCASTSPESCFGFRFLAVAERYLHLDRALGVHYGLEHSNGMSYMRGETSGAFADFMRLHGDRPWLEAAPIPGLSLGQNTFYHEYERVRATDVTGRFPPISMPGYLADLARNLPHVADPERRSDVAEILTAQGWEADCGTNQPALADLRIPRGDLLSRWRRWRADVLFARRDDLAATGLKREARALRTALQFVRPCVEPNDFIAPLQPLRLQ